LEGLDGGRVKDVEEDEEGDEQGANQARRQVDVA
jgi:hypothetical protein